MKKAYMAVLHVVIFGALLAPAIFAEANPLGNYDSYYSTSYEASTSNETASTTTTTTTPPPTYSARVDGYPEQYYMQPAGYYSSPPSSNTSAPSTNYSSPPASQNYTSPAPANNYQQPSNYNAPPPVANPTPTYNPPALTYSPPPVYSQPAPAYNQPPPNYKSPQPGYYPPPPPGYYAKAPAYNQPPPAYNPPPPPYYAQPPPVYSNPPPPAAPAYTPSPPAEYYSSTPAPVYSSPPPPSQEYYSSTPSPEYYSSSSSSTTTPPPTYYAPPPPPAYYTKDEVVEHQELNASIHCGILPAVNAALYKDTYVHGGYSNKSYAPYGTALLAKDDVVPFGLYPWVVQITDEYNNYLCAGTLIRSELILTLASCVQGKPLDKLRVRYGDWDVLNDENEYEVYKNYDTKICRSLPVTCPSYGYPAPASYGQLTLLQVVLPDDYDLYPHTKPVCLPEWPYKPPTPVYNHPPPPYFSPPGMYRNSPQVYSPAAPAAPAPTYYSPPEKYEKYAECWVEGYYASPTLELKPYQPPQASEGYSYPTNEYNTYPNNNSYSYAEQSKVPRRAQVKRIQPPYAYVNKAASCAEEQQWIGVNGYDACVADRGSAIICLVPEYYEEAAYPSKPPQQKPYAQPPQNETYPSTPYKEYKLAAAQTRGIRQRAVIVAVVQTPTQCTDYEQYANSYGGNAGNPYEKQQSKPITAVKVTDDVVDFIEDKVRDGALQCPAPRSYYHRDPESSHEYQYQHRRPPPPAYHDGQGPRYPIVPYAPPAHPHYVPHSPPPHRSRGPVPISYRFHNRGLH